MIWIIILSKKINLKLCLKRKNSKTLFLLIWKSKKIKIFLILEIRNPILSLILKIKYNSNLSYKLRKKEIAIFLIISKTRWEKLNKYNFNFFLNNLLHLPWDDLLIIWILHNSNNHSYSLILCQNKYHLIIKPKKAQNLIFNIIAVKLILPKMQPSFQVKNSNIFRLLSVPKLPLSKICKIKPQKIIKQEYNFLQPTQILEILRNTTNWMISLKTLPKIMLKIKICLEEKAQIILKKLGICKALLLHLSLNLIIFILLISLKVLIKTLAYTTTVKY